MTHSGAIRKKRIYISGKITGNENHIEEFTSAEYMLRERQECIVFNPIKLGVIFEGSTWEQYMLADLMILELCDTIYMLKNWKESKGAIIEHEKAVELGMNIIYEEE